MNSSTWNTKVASEHTGEKSHYEVVKEFSDKNIGSSTLNQSKNFAFHRVALCKRDCNYTFKVKMDVEADKEKRNLYNINNKNNR